MACRGAEVAVCIIAAAALRIDDVLEGGRHRTRMRVLHPHVCTHICMHGCRKRPRPPLGAFISSHFISSHFRCRCSAIRTLL